MARPPLDPSRGTEVAKVLKALGVKGPLIKAAELGYITEMKCAMRKCFCPEELGGAGYFEPRTPPWTLWEPTIEHFPIRKQDGGHTGVDNVILAHRICNKLDFSIAYGLSIEKDLEKIRRAREAAVGKVSSD